MPKTELDSELHKNKNTKHIPAAIFTQNKTTKIRIKDEIKFLYVKKEKKSYVV
jgi:hypothetical protein